ncbi:MAG TPA: hypothetical protein PKG52_01590 [bacterium]|nr:hypothetical protein [bacterium]
MRYDILIAIYLFAFVMTIILELPVVWFISCRIFKKPLKKAIISGLLSQVATHPLFIGILPVTVILLKSDAPQWLEFINNIYFKELLLIPLIEAGIYYLILKPDKKWHPFLISYAANLTSWGIGYFVPMKWIIELIVRVP